MHVNSTLRRTIPVVALALAALAIATAPVLLQQPFGSQTAGGLWLAHAARTWGSLATIGLASAVIWLTLLTARNVRWWGRMLLVLPAALVVGAAWLARQNAFEWWFNRLAVPKFVTAAEASFVEPNDLVLAIGRDADAAAFPIRLIAYHHIVNDRIGKTPAVVTY